MKKERAKATPPLTERALKKLVQELEKHKLELARANEILRQEIVERRRTEEALRESEERFRIAAESASDLIWDWDLKTNSLQWFGDVDMLLGYGKGEFPRTVKAWEKALHPEDHDHVMHALDKHLKTRSPYYAEYRIKCKDGTFRYWTDRGTAFWDKKGVPYRMVGSCADITERRQAEDERHLLEAQLLQSQKMESIGRLAGGIAHDLNNLLSPVLAYAEMILMKLGTGAVPEEEAREIKRAAELARDLTQRLLAFSRKQVLELRTVDLGQIVSGFENILRRTIREDIQIDMLVRTQGGLIQADIGQIEQILLNLAVNAQEAMPRGGVLTIEVSDTVLEETSTSKHSVVTPGEYMVLSVGDTGRGMDQAVLDRLFEPFFTTKGYGKGTGLGLSVVYGIVRQHGGYITVHSQPRHGTLFEIYFPRLMEKPASPSTYREGEGEVSHPPETLRASETVLIVEDEAMVRDVASRILKLQGYNVLVAGNITECIEFAEKHQGPIHLLLTDVIMPEMNGRELFKRLSSVRPGLRALFMSGYTGNVLADRRVLEGGMNFIQKPFSIQGLTDKVREVLDS